MRRVSSPSGEEYLVVVGPPGSGVDLGGLSSWGSTGGGRSAGSLERLLFPVYAVGAIVAAVRAAARAWTATGRRWRVVVEPVVARHGFWGPVVHRELFDGEAEARARADELVAMIEAGRPPGR